jgi:hypothetical protein
MNVEMPVVGPSARAGAGLFFVSARHVVNQLRQAGRTPNQ